MGVDITYGNFNELVGLSCRQWILENRPGNEVDFVVRCDDLGGGWVELSDGRYIERVNRSQFDGVNKVSEYIYKWLDVTACG